jgi:TetR/AcrR family transcriptional regulator, regulator of cefoperazone and chloramphenicol sensitivity
MPSHDQETRRRLIEAGERLFASRGFTHVTVRDICAAADANVAAVNYHFGDKLGLYTEIVQTAIAAMRETSEIVEHAGRAVPPEERLRGYVCGYLHRVRDADRAPWIHQLIAREMADPTPALDLLVEQAIRPRLTYLASVIADLLHAPIEDERVVRCATSVHAQCLSFVPTAVGRRLYPELEANGAALDALANHIVEFSLAGIRALARRG